MRFKTYETGIKKTRIKYEKWINRLQKEYDFEEHHVRLLILAGECWDRSQEARAILAKEGAYIKDRFDQRKPHPALQIEKESILTFTRVLREIGLDIERPEDSRPLSRPGGY